LHEAQGQRGDHWYQCENAEPDKVRSYEAVSDGGVGQLAAVAVLCRAEKVDHRDGKEENGNKRKSALGKRKAEGFGENLK